MNNNAISYFDNDITRCGNEGCPRYKKCYRGDGHYYKPGIYTFSLFSNECNEENGYPYFINGDKNGEIIGDIEIKPNEKYLFLMCGCPGSRKSSFLSMFCKLNKINYEKHVVSRDLIRFSIVSENEEYFSKEKEVFQLFINQIKYQIAFNNYCFADATHLNKSSRMKLVNSIGKGFLKDVNVVPLFVSVSEEVALYGNNLRKETRAYVPEEVIIRMRYSFSDPAQDNYPYADIYNIYPISTVTTDCGEITNIELKDKYEIHKRKKRS